MLAEILSTFGFVPFKLQVDCSYILKLQQASGDMHE